MSRSLTLHNQFPSIPFTDFPLSPGIFILGRSSKCDFVVHHDSVSRRHAEIRLIDGDVTVQDLASHNGTYVNDQPVRTGSVQKGQQLRFGAVSFLLVDARPDSEEPKSDVETGSGGKSKRAKVDAAASLLSKAQRRVLDLLFTGFAEKQIAARLNLSQHTVHNHIEAIYQILGVHSRVELLTRYLPKTGRQGTTLSW